MIRLGIPDRVPGTAPKRLCAARADSSLSSNLKTSTLREFKSSQIHFQIQMTVAACTVRSVIQTTKQKREPHSTNFHITGETDKLIWKIVWEPCEVRLIVCNLDGSFRDVHQEDLMQTLFAHIRLFGLLQHGDRRSARLAPSDPFARERL